MRWDAMGEDGGVEEGGHVEYRGGQSLYLTILQGYHGPGPMGRADGPPIALVLSSFLLLLTSVVAAAFWLESSAPLSPVLELEPIVTMFVAA